MRLSSEDAGGRGRHRCIGRLHGEAWVDAGIVLPLLRLSLGLGLGLHWHCCVGALVLLLSCCCREGHRNRRVDRLLLLLLAIGDRHSRGDVGGIRVQIRVSVCSWLLHRIVLPGRQRLAIGPHGDGDGDAGLVLGQLLLVARPRVELLRLHI